MFTAPKVKSSIKGFTVKRVPDFHKSTKKFNFKKAFYMGVIATVIFSSVGTVPNFTKADQPDNQNQNNQQNSPNRNFHFIKVICPSYSDIAGNTDADQYDVSGGQFVNFNNYVATSPHFPNPYVSMPITPAEIPQDCIGAAGWKFDIGTDINLSNQSTVGPTDSNGQITVPFSSLPAAIKSELTGGAHELWVSEQVQPQVANFGTLRCYNDAVNGDNLETIHFANANLDSDVYCIAYNVTPAPSQSDLGVTKTVNVSSALPGDNVKYTVTVTNNGPKDNTAVVINDLLPSGLNFVSASSTQGTYSGITGNWNVGSLVNGASAVLEITAQVNVNLAPGSITNTATVGSAALPDTNSSNNSASATVQVTNESFTLTLTKSGDGNGTVTGSSSDSSSLYCDLNQCDPSKEQTAFTQTYASGTVITLTAAPDANSNFNGTWSSTPTVCSGNDPVCTFTITGDTSVNAHFAANTSGSGSNGGGGGCAGNCNPIYADLSVVKTVDNATPASINTVVTFTLVVNNLGPNTATSTQLTDILPGDFTFVSASSTVGAYDSTTGVWTIGDMPNGDTQTLQISAKVLSNVGAVVTNTTNVTSSTADPNLANNTSSASVTLPGAGQGGGGCSGNCGNGGSSNGGGNSNNGGGNNGSNGGGTPAVLGASTPSPAPQGDVLGASTTLPRTGMPVNLTLIILAAAAFVTSKKLKLV